MSQQRRPRIGIMGGTFDPIHHGHLVAASEAQVALDLDEVIFVPTGQPADKPQVMSAEHRYLMTVIATASNPRFRVSRVDIDRPGITYTVDTLHDIRQEFPDSDLFFITGADAIASFLSWKESDSLTTKAHFVAVSRPGHELSVAELPGEGVTVLEVPALAISSTDCRDRVRAGHSVWYLVPDGVVQYIAKHRLYRSEQ
jgi:nicotinate-nucleotide adenylyltransferase